jgi:hypothetical protein
MVPTEVRSISKKKHVGKVYIALSEKLMACGLKEGIKAVCFL